MYHYLIKSAHFFHSTRLSKTEQTILWHQEIVVDLGVFRMIIRVFCADLQQNGELFIFIELYIFREVFYWKEQNKKLLILDLDIYDIFV
jgi:hypothetical protein